MILGTTPGQWVVKQVKPLTNYSKLLLTPAIISFQVAVGAGQLVGLSEGRECFACACLL